MKHDIERLISGDESPVMTAQDIVKIIRCASSCGVKSIQLGNFSCLFFKIDEKSDTPSVGKPTPEQSIEDENRAFLQETVQVKDAELESLIAVDPEKYEELITQGDLTDDGAEEKDNQ